MTGFKSDDVRRLPIEETGIVEMFVRERERHSGGANGMRYGWECALCQSSTGLEFDLKYVAEEALVAHLEQEHPRAMIAECTCVHDCLSCSHSGDWHAHEKACPVHPEAEVIQ